MPSGASPYTGLTLLPSVRMRTKYTVLERLGGGGQAEVFRGVAETIEGFKKAVAIKRVLPNLTENPQFVAMFIPGDSFLAAAQERYPDLMTEAMEGKVAIVTPTTLFGLCKAVAYGWRAEDQAKGAAKVAELGRELYKRIAVMGDHVSGLGKAIEAAVSRYNAFVGSLETQVMSQAKRFEELATHHEGKAIPDLKPVESGVRPTAKLSAVARDEDAAA